VWNHTRDRLSAIISDDYSLVLHEKAFSLVADGLDRLDTEVYGYVKNIEDVAIVEVYFPALRIKDDAKGMDVGGKIINSYNKSRAFKGFMVANRLVCTNGMYARKLIPDVNFFEIHVGDLAERIPELIEEFFENLKDATEDLKAIIDQAMNVYIEFNSEDEIEPTIAGILNSPRHAKKLMEGKYYYDQVKDPVNPSKWELYNAITAYASHAALVESRVDVLSNSAETLLHPEYQVVVIAPEIQKTT